MASSWPITIFIAMLLTLPSSFLSVWFCGTQNCIRDLRWGCTSAEQSGTTTNIYFFSVTPNVAYMEPLFTVLSKGCFLKTSLLVTVLWFNSSWQLSPTWLLTQSCPVGWERELREKVRKLTDQDKDSLTGRAKAAHASEAKQDEELIHHFPVAGRCSAVSRKTGLHHTVTWEDKHYHAQHPPLPFSLSFIS